ncbi:MAG: hypothetical protein JOZ19_01810, partial [Rubrobacter sp.]|nr:hypothetical protein [Rubrobacter sp.]
ESIRRAHRRMVAAGTTISSVASSALTAERVVVSSATQHEQDRVRNG